MCIHPLYRELLAKKKNVYKIVKKMGRPFKLSERSIRLFKKYAVNNSFKPLNLIFTRLNNTTELNISESPAKRYMKKLKMYSFIAVQKPFISTKNMSARIVWARTHEHWTQSKWMEVMFTDESSFTVRPKKNRMHVWRKKRERLRLKHIVPTFKSGYQNVSVWCGFSAKGRTPLVGPVGSFTSEIYRVIIGIHILPFMYDTHDRPATFVLQEDNCGPHRAKNFATYLQNEEVNRMKWPAQSPDLNPIENVWAFMKSKLRKRYVHPKNPIELFAILSEM